MKKVKNHLKVDAEKGFLNYLFSLSVDFKIMIIAAVCS